MAMVICVALVGCTGSGVHLSPQSVPPPDDALAINRYLEARAVITGRHPVIVLCHDAALSDGAVAASRAAVGKAYLSVDNNCGPEFGSAIDTLQVTGFVTDRDMGVVTAMMHVAGLPSWHERAELTRFAPVSLTFTFDAAIPNRWGPGNQPAAQATDQVGRYGLMDYLVSRSQLVQDRPMVVLCGDKLSRDAREALRELAVSWRIVRTVVADDTCQIPALAQQDTSIVVLRIRQHTHDGMSFHLIADRWVGGRAILRAWRETFVLSRNRVPTWRIDSIAVYPRN